MHRFINEVKQLCEIGLKRRQKWYQALRISNHYQGIVHQRWYQALRASSHCHGILVAEGNYQNLGQNENGNNLRKKPIIDCR